MTGAQRGSMPLAALFLVAAVVFAIGTVFYLTQNTSFLASEYGHHTKHAILLAVLTVVSLIGANFARPKA